MGLKDWLKKLERSARSDMGSFVLLDGSTYYHSPEKSYAALLVHCYDCLKAGNPQNWPEPPELLLRICEARDPGPALEEIMTPALEGVFPYSWEAIVTERKLVPVSVVVGRDVNGADIDLSE